MIGILSCLDGYMNAALENTEEVVNGKVLRNYGDAFIRGNNSQCWNSSSLPIRIPFLTSLLHSSVYNVKRAMKGLLMESLCTSTLLACRYSHSQWTCGKASQDANRQQAQNEKNCRERITGALSAGPHQSQDGPPMRRSGRLSMTSR